MGLLMKEVGEGGQGTEAEPLCNLCGTDSLTHIGNRQIQLQGSNILMRRNTNLPFEAPDNMVYVMVQFLCNTIDRQLTGGKGMNGAQCVGIVGTSVSNHRKQCIHRRILPDQQSIFFDCICQEGKYV